jgi:hypothetical protein
MIHHTPSDTQHLGLPWGAAGAMDGYMHVTETHGDRDTWIQRHIEAHRDI